MRAFRFSVVLVFLVATTALAANYEVPINISDEDDILALEQNGDISSATAEILIDLLTEGVDLNSATREQLYDLPGLSYDDVDRILLYRTNKGRIEEPTELVGAEALSEEQLLTIVPFIRLDPDSPRLPVSGRFRLVGAMMNGDFLPKSGVVPPAGFLQGRMKGPLNLSVGFFLNGTRRNTGSPYYESFRDTLAVDPIAWRPALPYIWGQWRSGSRRVVVGTFHLGFAERLTLDNTRRFTPSGLYITETPIRQIDATTSCRTSGGDPVVNGCGDEQNYLTPDFRTRTPFRGVAGSIEDLEFGNGQKMSLYAFLSYQTRSVYQYELYDQRFCDDPNGTSDSCKAPDVAVLRDRNDTTDPTRLIYTTLPALYEELAGGGHADYKPTDALRIGLTGYGASNFFHASPMKLDFQEWSSTPWGGPFGAIGVDAKYSISDFALTAELARSFDSEKSGGGGGFGFIQRTVWSPRHHEVELSLRYYDNGFGNPYARPIAAPDESQGQRARNEAGARVRYEGKLPYDFELRARADFWVLPFTSKTGFAGTANLNLYARVDYTGLRRVHPAIQIDYRNRNLASSVHGGCAVDNFNEIDLTTVDGEPVACSGDYVRLSTRVSVRPFGNKLLDLIPQLAVTFRDDPKYKDRFLSALQLGFEARSQPVDWLLLRARLRFLDRDITDNTYLEHSVWTRFEATYIYSKNWRFGLRYDVYAFVDQRDSTLTRRPNPEHRFFADVRAGF